jgi:hypothetical protein
MSKINPSSDYLARLKLIVQECPSETGMEFDEFYDKYKNPVYFDEEYGYRLKP